MLLARLHQYPVERYPVQHATTQFHLGSVLLHSGDTVSALQALTTGRALFERAGMRLEQAKATVMVGATLRACGRLAEAAAAFDVAVADFAALEAPAEQAAASYNLGLVLATAEQPRAAHAAWTSARELFLEARYPAQAAAAARDHGASLLRAGDVAGALALLEQASELAERAGDEPGHGAARNALGLAHLAARDPTAAVSDFEGALGSFPRSVRPAEYAMAKANLALAWEQAREPARARLAAEQALAVAAAAAPVRAQARQLLARLPAGAEPDLLVVLDTAGPERLVAVLRDEVLRTTDLSEAQRHAAVRGFLDGLLTRPGVAQDLAASLLQVVLELPPRTYQLLVSAIVDACADRSERDTERLHAVIGSALARFALPQWQRLAASLNAAAEATGQPATWR